MPPLDLGAPRRLHVVGAGGSGMSAIAALLVQMGHAVSGCDAAPSPALERLAAAGVDTSVGHDPAHVLGVDAVTASTAIPRDSLELAAADAAGVPVLRRAEALSALCATRRTIAVSGTHGKTTTTALMAVAMDGGGLDPSFLVGADLVDGPSARWGGGEWFVVEADESDGTFVELGAEAVVVTNVEPDHLDHHGSVEGLHGAFRRFLSDADARIVCADDPGAVAVAAGLEVVTYGTSPGVDHQIVDLEPSADGVAFTLLDGSQPLGRVWLPLPGTHNARNAAGALAVAVRLGAPLAACADALATFGGVRRRFERRGEAAGVTFVDSYDHLPGEVAAVLAAARDGGWDRIVCAFQPHRYTRTAALWRDFGPAFSGADVVAVTDVYAAGQAPIPGVTGQLVADAVAAADPARPVAYLADREDLVDFLAAELQRGDLCLTLGAGDLTSVPDELLERLRER